MGVVDALENVDGYRMASAADSTKKKARRNGLFMVAGTGFEAVTGGSRKAIGGRKRA
jgi:hypothetical protein